MYASILPFHQLKPTRLYSPSQPPKQRFLPSPQSFPSLRPPAVSSPPRIQKPRTSFAALKRPELVASLLGAGIAVSLLGPASAAELPSLGSSIQLTEPSNALSLPTWAIHVSSVVEWITAMVLVWQYGEKPGREAWKSLSWGMVPLLGGAFCACTWHFFYNSESLEVLVALQAALTVVGNATMCLAAFRIYKSQGS